MDRIFKQGKDHQHSQKNNAPAVVLKMGAHGGHRLHIFIIEKGILSEY